MNEKIMTLNDLYEKIDDEERVVIASEYMNGTIEIDIADIDMLSGSLRNGEVKRIDYGEHHLEILVEPLLEGEEG